jgi:flagellar protein FlgJ
MTSLTKIATQAASTATKAASPELDKLKGAAKQFEAVFLRQMIGSMRSASDGEGLFDSSATQQFRDMSDSKLAEQMASKGALHIADMLVKAYGARLGVTTGDGSQAAAQVKSEIQTKVTSAVSGAATAVTAATNAAAASAAATLKLGTGS